MMTCQELVELLGDLVAQELTPEQQAEADHHLQVCPPCAAVHETYRLTIRLAHRLAPLPLPPGLVARLRAAMESSATSPQPISDGTDGTDGTDGREDGKPGDPGASAESGHPDQR